MTHPYHKLLSMLLVNNHLTETSEIVKHFMEYKVENQIIDSDPNYTNSYCFSFDDLQFNIFSGKLNQTFKFKTEYISVVVTDKVTKDIVAELNTTNSVIAYNFLVSYL